MFYRASKKKITLKIYLTLETLNIKIYPHSITGKTIAYTSLISSRVMGAFSRYKLLYICNDTIDN